MLMVLVAGEPLNDCMNSSRIELPSSLIDPLMTVCTFCPFISPSMFTVHFLSPSILLVEIVQPAMLSHHRSLYSFAFLSHQRVPCPVNGPIEPLALKFCSIPNPPGAFVTVITPLSVLPFGAHGPGSVLTVADHVPSML